MSYEDFVQKTEENIARTGVSVVGVGSSETEPTFSYSVGFSDRGWPEVIIVGLCPTIAMHLVNNLAKRDDPPQVGETLLDIATVPLRVGAVSETNVEEYLCQAVFRAVRWGKEKPTAVQLVYPDTECRFPDNPAYNLPPVVQPILA
jgi:hypothetical protein